MAKSTKKHFINFSDNDQKIFEKLYTGDTPQRRGAKIFQMLILLENFKPTIKKFRSDFFASLSKEEKNKIDNGQLPKICIKNAEVFRDLAVSEKYALDKKTEKEIEKYIEPIINNYLKTHDLFTDNLIKQIIIEYVLFNDIYMLGCDVGSLNRTEYDEEMENEIVFTFMAGVKKDEALEFIASNWDAVQIFQNQILKSSNSRIKIPKHFPRDIKIYNTYINLLAVQPKDRDSRYLETSVKKELAKIGIIVTGETIKSVVSRIQKLKDSINRCNGNGK